MPTTSFDSLPGDARIWVYACDRALTDPEVSIAEAHFRAFTDAWTSHGSDLLAAARIFENRFLVLALDDRSTAASGCSIDKSVRAVLDSEIQLGCSWTNRLIVWTHDSGNWQRRSLSEVKKLWSNGNWPEHTTVADTTVLIKKAWESALFAAPETTWIAGR